MTVGKITKRSVDALELGEQLFDKEISGFVVRFVGKRRIYGLKYKVDGRQRLFTIGYHGERTDDGQSLTPENARKKALSLRGRIANGEDPQKERAAMRDQISKAPDIAALADRYLSEYVNTHNKPSTQREVRRVVKTRIKPAFGKLRVEELTRKQAQRWHEDMKATPYEANRSLSYLHKMMALAVGWELRADNPCARIKRFPEKKRERFFGEPELTVIGEAVSGLDTARDKDDDPIHESAIALLRFLALTGMRLTEARTLRWAEVDLSGPTLHLGDAKAGSRSIPLGAPAAALLASLVRSGEYVFPSLTDEEAVRESAFRKLWKRIRKITGIKNARPHDLRHTLGTYIAQTGANAFVVRDLLGHKTMAMTGRYVERAVDPLRATADATANRISAAMSGQSAEIIPIKGKSRKKRQT